MPGCKHKKCEVVKITVGRDGSITVYERCVECGYVKFHGE